MKQLRTALFWILGVWTTLFVVVVSTVLIFAPDEPIRSERVGWTLALTWFAWLTLVFWHFAARDYNRYHPK